MSKARRKSAMVRRIDRELPGVGIYTPAEVSTKKQAANFSMGKKLKLRKKSNLGAESPGPAAYRTYELILSPRRSISIPKEKRPIGADLTEKL